MLTLQQQKDAIDEEARLKKIEVEEIAIKERQDAADEEIEKLRLETEYKIQEIKNNAQK